MFFVTAANDSTKNIIQNEMDENIVDEKVKV